MLRLPLIRFIDYANGRRSKHFLQQSLFGVRLGKFGLEAQH
ncbi:hypothetical protein [Devosia neptuniae]|nr:hypothetical protein [Devosia neptuniae]MCZ4345539.1 hypothetical protein [Devosia neptuniae]